MSEIKLERKLGLAQATAINMIDMVGIGPFITLPMVISMMNGPYFLYAWIAGAVVNLGLHFQRQEDLTISLKKHTIKTRQVNS